MKKIINSMRHGVFALAAILTMASCSDWTEPESLDQYVPTLEEENPELYAAYIENLNAYKAGDHKVMFVTFDNPAEVPASQAYRLTALPDSIDYVSLNVPDNLGATVVADMEAVREKGTRIVYDVNYPAIESAWELLVREDATLTEEQALAFIEERTNEALALCDKWGYDGVTFTYTGKALGGMPVADLEVYTARQTKFIELLSTWRAAHASKAFSFIGRPQYIVKDDLVDNKAILAQCDYIILSTELAKSENELTTTAQWAVAEGAPADRIVVLQYMADANDTNKEGNGFFGTFDNAGTKSPSIPITAAWMGKPSPDFTRHGMMIRNGQLDYFQSNPTWGVTRRTIATMNP